MACGSGLVWSGLADPAAADPPPRLAASIVDHTRIGPKPVSNVMIVFALKFIRYDVSHSKFLRLHLRPFGSTPTYNVKPSGAVAE